MSDYKLSKEEQETIILGNAASKQWDICTADPKIIRKMARQGYKQAERSNPWGYVSFLIPFDRVKIAKSIKKSSLGLRFKPKNVPQQDEKTD